MKLAICAPFMESDLWQERLRRLRPGRRWSLTSSTARRKSAPSPVSGMMPGWWS